MNRFRCIRLRNRFKDDSMILRLIYTELVPLARKAYPNLNPKKALVRKRLDQGVTFVAAPATAPIGFVNLKVEEKVLFVEMLAVAKSQQGRGWGGILMQRAEQYGLSR